MISLSDSQLAKEDPTLCFSLHLATKAGGEAPRGWGLEQFPGQAGGQGG